MVTSPNYGLLAESITLHGKQLLHPKKHCLKPNEQPTEKKRPRDSYERKNAIFLDNCRQRQMTMTPARKALLNSIHTVRLNHFNRLRRNFLPLHGWTDQFVAWASRTANAAVRLRYSTINKHSFEKLYDTAKGYTWFNADGSNPSTWGTS